MKAIYFAILAGSLAGSAEAQIFYVDCVPVQCGPNGCCPPPQYYCPPPQYYQQQPQQPQLPPVPDVGSEGTPKFTPREPEIPPLSKPDLPPPPPVTTPPMEKPEPTVDPKALADALREQKAFNEAQQKKLDEGFKSIVVAIEANKCDCAPTDLTGVNLKLDALLAFITTQPTQPTPAPNAEQHVVIVADHNAPYWQRLAEKINDTKKTYAGLKEAPLPAFHIGPHPQAVVYQNRVPVRIVKGQYEVEALLSRLARNEPI